MSVPEEIAAGDGLSLSAAGRLLPGRRGERVSPSTILRWCLKGAKALDGRVVRLEACRVGSVWMTTAGPIARFVEALSAAAAVEPKAASTRSAARAAGRELDRLGL